MSSSLRLELYTPVIDDRPIFLAGAINGWHPCDERFRLQPVGEGHYVLEFPGGEPLPESFEYKYTKGGWEHVELGSTGEGVLNRSCSGASHVEPDIVPHWRWYGNQFNPDFLPRIELISDHFDLPQLGTTRRVHVLLPHDYDVHAEKHYPVLYLHDGQNLFGEGTGYGSWQIEQKMAILASRANHELILVSIDHGETERIREFTLESTKAGKGKGRFYLEFITQTLKPFVDSSFRTVSDPENTGIGGSSLGGLISIYAGLRHPDVFGRLLVFSPSLWISPKIYFDAIRFKAPVPMRVFVYGGEAEGAYMVPNLQRFKDALVRQQYGGHTIDMYLSVDPEGTHQEQHWSREFPRAVEWLFYGHH